MQWDHAEHWLGSPDLEKIRITKKKLFVYIIVDFSEEGQPKKNEDDSEHNQKDNEDYQFNSESITKLTIQALLEGANQCSKGLFKVGGS